MGKRELYRPLDFQIGESPEVLQNSLENQMVAMGKALVRANKKLNIDEYKLLIMALTKINWKKLDKNSTNEYSKLDKNLTVELSKLEIADIMNWEIDASDRSTKVRYLAAKLRRHSEIFMDRKDSEEWDDGFLVPRVSSTKGYIKIYFAEQYRPLLENLLKDKDFITVWANDIYKFNSLYSYMLYEELRLHCDTRTTNYREYTTKQLKELFNIPKDGQGSYMHFDSKKGKNVFDRYNFEKKVIDTAIKEINLGKMMQIFPIIGSSEIEKKKCYEKIKKGAYVARYRFKYIVKTRQVPTEQELKDQAERDREDHLPGLVC